MNNGPPKDANAGELWTRLTQTPRPVSEPHSFRARGRDIATLRFRVLTADELALVRLRANDSTKAMLGEDAKTGNLAYEEEYENQKCLQLLSLACRQPEPEADGHYGEWPTFPSPKDVKAQLTDDEIAVGVAAYGMFRRESGPYVSLLTEEEMEAWIKLLMEGASRFPLARLSGEVLSDLVMYLVSKLCAGSSTATSSAGSPPAASSTGEGSPGG